MPKISAQHTVIAKPAFTARKKASAQPPDLGKIVKKLDDFVRQQTSFTLEISKQEVNLCKTVEIPDRVIRQKLVELTFSEKLKNEPVSEALASNENIISGSNEAMEIFIRVTSGPHDMNNRKLARIMAVDDEDDDGRVCLGWDDQSSNNVSAVKRGFCVNKNIIPLENCERDADRREKITDYIMQNSNKPLASLLARNENLSKCEGITALQTWAEEFSGSPVRATSTTAVNIKENLRRQQKKLQTLDKKDDRKSSDSIVSTGSLITEVPKAVMKIITRIKDNPRGASLDRADRLSLMSYAGSLISMQGEEEKFVFELMQNPDILTSTTWQTTISKTNFCFSKGKSDHGFVLGLALNEQKNKIENFRKALLQLAVKYPHSEFSKNVLSGLTEFNIEDLQLISAILKHNSALKTILVKNKSYQTAVKKLKIQTE